MLTKKDKKKRYNKKTKSSDIHLFSGTAVQDFKDSFKGDKLGGTIGALGSNVAGIIGESIKEPELQGTEAVTDAIETQQNFQSSANTNDDLLAEMSGFTNVRTDYNAKEFKRGAGEVAGEFIGDAVSSFATGASSGSWITGLVNTGLSFIKNGIKRGRENAAARQFAQDASANAKKANLAKAQTLTAKAGALDQAADQRALAAYAAYGGDINTPKFPDFPSKITEFNTGGSHEENPYDGIPQGIAPDGLPNLVEEGEVKYDNYIFSDRLMLNKNDKKKYKFLKGKTYADAAKAIKKELGIDERPNDLIAKTDLEEHLNILSTLQEEERAKRGLRGENRMMYAKGGRLFDLGGEADEMGEVEDYVSDEFREGNSIPLYLTNPTVYKRNPLLPQPRSKSFDWSSLGQAAPTIASSISGLVQSVQGHDRSIADKLYNYEPERSYTKAPQVTTPKVNISKYKIDEEQAARENDAMVLATMRAARESSTNPLAAMNQINAASYAGQIASGKARADAKKANFDIEMAGNQFNLGIDQLQGNFDLAAEKLNAAERDAYNKLKYQALATGASADIRSKESYEDALGKTWTSAAENMNTLAHDKIYDEMVAEYLKNKNAALGGPLSIQKSKNKIRGKKRNRLV